MSILLLGIIFSSRAVGQTQLLHLPPQATPLTTRSSFTPNATIPCFFNGVEYFVSSSSPSLITCDSILRDVTMSVNDRSVTGILWSCLATVFACTWVSVHPDIPHPDATEWQIRRHRFFMMLCGLVAPELIVLWALRQWIGARFVVRRMIRKKIRGFTIVHAHFMQMGGFMLYSNESRIGVIENYNQLASCIIDWKFKLPTAEEIQDRSKGDGLSKALVVGQTAWFVAQCLSRWIAGLAITEMELVTLAFAALNGIIYFLWWNKPLDVRYAVPVVRQAPDNGTAADNPLHLSSNYKITTVFRDIDDLQTMRRLVANSRIGRLFLALKAYRNQGDEEVEDQRLKISALHSNCDPQDTFAATAVSSAIGILFGAVHCVAWNFHFLSQHERTLWRVWSVIITTVPIVLFAKSVISYLYIWRIVHDDEIIASHSGVGRVGGAVRTIIGQISRLSIWATIFLVPAYVVARIGLLVQALFALRDLQPGERAQVQWVDFLPHL